MPDYDLVGVCGLYCGACEHFVASLPEGQHLMLDHTKEYLCKGCRSGSANLYKSCVRCIIRDCAEQKQLEHCGQCSSFPCNMLTAFQHDGIAHHVDILTNAVKLNEKGTDIWLKEQKANWSCTCGAVYSWYAHTCSQCGEPLHSYGSDSDFDLEG